MRPSLLPPRLQVLLRRLLLEVGHAESHPGERGHSEVLLGPLRLAVHLGVAEDQPAERGLSAAPGTDDDANPPVALLDR